MNLTFNCIAEKRNTDKGTVTAAGTSPKWTLDPAIHSLEYVNNFTLLGCLIGFCGTVNLSKLIHAWVYFQEQAVARSLIVEHREEFTVTVDEARRLTVRVSGLLLPSQCSCLSRLGTWECHVPAQQRSLQVLCTGAVASTATAMLEEETISVLFKAKSKCKLASSVEVKPVMG